MVEIPFKTDYQWRKDYNSNSPERELFIGNLLVRIHFIIVMIKWIGCAPWEFEFSFPGSLISILVQVVEIPFKTDFQWRKDSNHNSPIPGNEQ